jgi:hypothetical protein
MLSRAHDVPLLIVANLEAVCLGLPDKCRDMMHLLMFDILIIENYVLWTTMLVMDPKGRRSGYYAAEEIESMNLAPFGFEQPADRRLIFII